MTGTLANLVTTSWGEACHDLSILRRLFSTVGNNVFWDGKWDDIPNTTQGAAKAIQPLSPLFFNVHAAAGRKAIERAVANKGHSKVLGVTVLTSIDPDECQSIFGDVPRKVVIRFAGMLLEEGADGIICSPQELTILRQQPALQELLMITPGIRPAWAAASDQKRVMTPGEAVKAGADYLVIGRPITQPPKETGSPVTAANLIAEEITSALR